MYLALSKDMCLTVSCHHLKERVRTYNTSKKCYPTSNDENISIRMVRQLRALRLRQYHVQLSVHPSPGS